MAKLKETELEQGLLGAGWGEDLEMLVWRDRVSITQNELCPVLVRPAR